MLTLIIAVLCLAGTAAVYGRESSARSKLEELTRLGRPVYCGGTSGNFVALTFDDGPGPATPELLAALRHAHARATFFLVGARITYWPHFAAADAGVGAIGNHTWDHPHLLRLPPGRVATELRRTQGEIWARVGLHARLFRPPYEQADAAVDRAAQRLGLLDVRWSVDSGDSTGAGRGDVVRTVVDGLRPGAIILMHDHPGTATALRSILPAIARRGLVAVTVPDLLELDPPTSTQMRSTGNARCPQR